MAHREGVGRLGAAGGGGGVSCAALLGPEVVNETAHLNGCGLVGVACVLVGWLVGWLVGLALVCAFVCAFVSALCVRFVVCSRVSCPGLRFVECVPEPSNLPVWFYGIYRVVLSTYRGAGLSRPAALRGLESAESSSGRRIGYSRAA